MANGPRIFKVTDETGKCIQYLKGDIVYKNGEAYYADRDPALCLSPEHTNSGWKPLIGDRTSSTVSFFSSTVPPSRVLQGDEWFNPNTGKLYKYIKDTNSEQWVELF